MIVVFFDLSFYFVWYVQLELVYVCVGDVICLVMWCYVGLLWVQKYFYVEGLEVCQYIFVYLFGGIVGGDSLVFDVCFGECVWVQFISFGVVKWYCVVCLLWQILEIYLEFGVILEWLLQESIVFVGVQVELEICIQLCGDVCLFYWDMVVFGCLVSGECFVSGYFVVVLDICCDDCLFWYECQCIDGGDCLFDLLIGFVGYLVLVILVVSGEIDIDLL